MNKKTDPGIPDRNKARVITLPSRNMPDGHPQSKEKCLAALFNFNMLMDLDKLLDAHFTKSKGQ